MHAVSIPSIFANVSVTQFRDVSKFHEFNNGGSVAFDLQNSSAWLTTEGKAWYALGTKGGSHLLVCLSPIGLKGVSFQEEVREASIMQRLCSGICPGATGCGQEVPDTPHSVVVHPFEQHTVAFTICRDHRLRGWSCSNNECIISMDLKELLSSGSEVSEEPPVLHHEICVAYGGPFLNSILCVFLILSKSKIGKKNVSHLATIH